MTGDPINQRISNPQVKCRSPQKLQKETQKTIKCEIQNLPRFGKSKQSKAKHCENLKIEHEQENKRLLKQLRTANCKFEITAQAKLESKNRNLEVLLNKRDRELMQFDCILRKKNEEIQTPEQTYSNEIVMPANVLIPKHPPHPPRHGGNPIWCQDGCPHILIH